MHENNIMYILLICLLCLIRLSYGSINTEDYINNQLYTVLTSADPCVRLLTSEKTVGCSTTSPMEGVLRLATTQEQFDQLINQHTSEYIAVLLSQDLFNKNNIDLLQNSLQIAGILVSPSASNRPWSPDQPNPNDKYSNKHSATFEWNPYGDSLILSSFNYAIVLLTNDEAIYVEKQALINENNIKQSSFAYYYVEFSYHMFANDNSIDCLKSSTCFPVGGHSVYSTIGPDLSFNTSIILGISNMDSMSFFHGKSIGADADMTGLTVMLQVVKSLGQLSNNIKSSLKSTILLAIFDGESYSNVGSRKFIDDILYFKCHDYANNNRCQTPFKYNLNFENINHKMIKSILEVKQIGLNNTIFTHESGTLSTKLNYLLNNITNIANNINGLSILPSAPDTPSLPPSSSKVFDLLLPEIPKVVLTDHRRQYINEHYHSQYDTSLNINPDQHHLCRVATLLSRSLFITAGGSETDAELYINPDCDETTQLYRCLTEDMACELLNKYGGTESMMSHYASIFELEETSYIGGMSKVIYNWMNENIINNTNIYYHDAVDPVLVFDYNNKLWNVNNSRLNETFLWTESNWPDEQYSRIYRVESKQTQISILVSGLIVLFTSIIIVKGMLKIGEMKFKSL